MSVCQKENPAFLRESLNSMAVQTSAPAEIVMVCDGPLTPELESMLNLFSNLYPGLLQTLRLSQNKGLGEALRLGISQCKTELIARMDTDDISVPARCELQLAAFLQNPDAVIIGGQIHEFVNMSEESGTKRVLPCLDEDIRVFSKKRNPFNHMSVMFRRAAVLSAGNYQHMPFFEDYWLWMRLLRIGKGVNLPNVLVHARAGDDMIARRGGFPYVRYSLNFQHVLYQNGYIAGSEYLRNILARTVTGIVPNRIRRTIYRGLLRR